MSATIATSLIYKKENEFGKPFTISIGFKKFKIQHYKKVTKNGEKMATIIKTPDGVKLPVAYFEPTNEVTLDNKEIFIDKKGKFYFTGKKIPKREYL